MATNYIDQMEPSLPVKRMAVADKILVSAIDFGTTYSGYAFSWNSDFKEDPFKIQVNNWSKVQTGIGLSFKTPSCILFNKNKEFEAFGYEAETRYTQLCNEASHYDWYYFRHFKMLLYMEKELNRNTMLQDNRYKQMPAMDVFTASIRFLKDHMIKTLAQDPIVSHDIHWVLTVPAIWSDAAKQFMREAAINAEIHTDKLSLALEPEAASLFCRYLPIQKVGGVDSTEIRPFTIGDGYLVLDVGGGTVDITVHQVQPDTTIKELHKANGGEWGGMKVDKQFENLLNEVIGYDVMEIFQHTFREDYIELMTAFELKKRTTKPDSTARIHFQFPLSISSQYKDINSTSLENSNLIPDKFNGKVIFTRDKMKIDADLMKGLFEETCNNICSLIHRTLSEIPHINITKILMVGGFSESQILQDKLRRAFPDKRFIIPEEAGLAVLKGAVIFGHNPQMITSRVCKYSYGIQAFKHFEPALDPISKRVFAFNTALCKDHFSKHAEVGQEFQPGEMVGSQEYVPSEQGNTTLRLSVYISPRRYPCYTDEENCRKIGEMNVKLMDNSDGIDKPVVVQFVFGNTEIGIVAKEKKTGKETSAHFDFL